ncbi:MAG: hypothetical protein H0X30_30550 [Anaerolineae bacterium]|nr:hypothetical protein [Anaerolineae bacterium]
MAITSEFENELQKLLTGLTDHPTHEYGPKQRQKLFYLFKSDPFGMLVWRWLAFITARHVLPIYEVFASELNQNDWYFNLKFPRRSLYMAKKVLLGKEQAQVGYDMANGAYDPKDFDYGWRALRPVPFNVYQASWAASMALLEVSANDLDPFRHLANIAFYSDGFTIARGISKDIQATYPDSIPGEDFTDALWAESGHSDTAAAASSAWACEGLSREPDPNKLLEFWHWWLTEAIPQAWELAETHKSA